MMKIKQSEVRRNPLQSPTTSIIFWTLTFSYSLQSELQHLQEIINVNKQELNAISEEIEQKDEEIERMQQVVEEYKEEIQTKDDEIQSLKEKVHEFEKIKGLMNEETEELKDRLDSQEEEKNKFEDEIRAWSEKYHKLQQNLDDQALRSSQMQEQYEFKCNEVEVLQDCLQQIKGDEDEEDDEGEPLSEEESKNLLEILYICSIFIAL